MDMFILGVFAGLVLAALIFLFCVKGEIVIRIS